MNQSVSIFLNPPFALSIVILLAFFNQYHRPDSRSRFIWLALTAGLLAQVKIYAFILLLLALLIAKEIKLFISAGLFGLILSLPVLGLQGSPFIFSPLWFPKSLIAAQDKLNLRKLAEAWQVYEINGVYLKLFLVDIFSIGIYLVGNLGIRVIGLFGILKNDFVAIKNKWFQSEKQHLSGMILMKIIIVIGLVFPMFFIQRHNPWNTIQFSYYSLFFLGILTAKQFTIKKRSLVTWIIFLLLTIPTTIGTLQDYLTQYSASKISFTELQALETLKTAKFGVVVSPIFDYKKSKPIPAPKPLYAYTSTAYISAISGQPEYLSDLMNLDITGFQYQDRLANVQKLFTSNNFRWIKDFLSKENIRYVYQTYPAKLHIDPKSACLSPIFDSPEVMIYKFSCN